jgi:hypothetical protein
MPCKDKDKQREYMREYRKRMTDEQKLKARQRIAKREDEIQAWFKCYKEEQKCQRCPENHPACLEFHHIDPTTKEANIYDAVWNLGWCKERILAEIAKCEVLCANCHKKHHG